MKRDNKSGRFLPIPKSQKTPRMLEIETFLGKTLEEDYLDNYINNGWGQKRLAQRWNTSRNLIFKSRPNSPSWIERLNLPLRDSSFSSNNVEGDAFVNSLCCEICGEDVGSLDRAHWIANSDGGSREPSNILKLCPNCHRKLDRDVKETVSLARDIILFRESTKIINSNANPGLKRKRLRLVCESIIRRLPVEQLSD